MQGAPLTAPGPSAMVRARPHPEPLLRVVDGHLSADRRGVGEPLSAARTRRGGRIPVGHVRGRRRLPDDAAADLHRHSAAGRGRLRGQPDPGIVVLGRARPYAPRQRRPEMGDGAGGRRLRRLGVRRLAVRPAAPAGPDRPGDLALLRGVPRHHRRPDAGRERWAPGFAAARAPAPAPGGIAHLGCTACRSRCGSTARGSTSAR